MLARRKLEARLRSLDTRERRLVDEQNEAYERINVMERRRAGLRSAHDPTAGDPVASARNRTEYVALHDEVQRDLVKLSVLRQSLEAVRTLKHQHEVLLHDAITPLPEKDELQRAAVEAEAVLAKLDELADVSRRAQFNLVDGLTPEERALYEELERESRGSQERPDATEA
jgi:hypothetical protein